jgi:hypothetical protein
MRKKRTPVERAIIYAGVLGGLDKLKIDELLSSANLPSNVPQSTIDLIKRNEVPAWLKNPDLLGKHIYHPEPYGEMK